MSASALSSASPSKAHPFIGDQLSFDEMEKCLDVMLEDSPGKRGSVQFGDVQIEGMISGDLADKETKGKMQRKSQGKTSKKGSKARAKRGVSNERQPAQEDTDVRKTSQEMYDQDPSMSQGGPRTSESDPSILKQKDDATAEAVLELKQARACAKEQDATELVHSHATDLAEALSELKQARAGAEELIHLEIKQANITIDECEEFFSGELLEERKRREELVVNHREILDNVEREREELLEKHKQNEAIAKKGRESLESMEILKKETTKHREALENLEIEESFNESKLWSQIDDLATQRAQLRKQLLNQKDKFEEFQEERNEMAAALQAQENSMREKQQNQSDLEKYVGTMKHECSSLHFELAELRRSNTSEVAQIRKEADKQKLVDKRKLVEHSQEQIQLAEARVASEAKECEERSKLIDELQEENENNNRLVAELQEENDKTTFTKCCCCYCGGRKRKG